MSAVEEKMIPDPAKSFGTNTRAVLYQMSALHHTAMAFLVLWQEL